MGDSATKAVAELIQLGVLGPVLILAGLYILKLHRELREVHEKRTADAQAVVDKLMQLYEEWHQTLSSHVKAMEEQSSALADLRDAFKETMTEFRRRK